MSITKTKREKKRQLGQFLTPPQTARQLVEQLPLRPQDKVLEPSMGDGSFILPLIEKFMLFYDGSTAERLAQVLTHNIYGVEIDEILYHKCLTNIKQRWGTLPAQHHFYRQDFFRTHFQPNSVISAVKFNYIIGNPPFGGTIDPAIQDELDKIYGFRNGEKIKKETYSFFIVKSLDLLAPQGVLLFICSDTFLTIKTMRGLRRLLMSQGEVQITDLAFFSEETNHPMVVLRFQKNGYQNQILVNHSTIERSKIELTDNFSWRIHDGVVKYFDGPSLGEFVVATSGMTVGKNEYFVRKIVDGNIIEEPYEFEFFDDPITLNKEKAKARLGKLSPKKVSEIQQKEQMGATRRNVRVVPRPTPLRLTLPHPDYAYYNKGIQALVYSPPTHAIFWKDDGDAVLTFKKNGNWYLHGVGGQKFFLREGLTWQLIAQTLHIRYLPAGYILDSGAPCAFLRDGVSHDELYFICGWALTKRCNQLLKEVINHTKNIQGKDFERLPYPFWVRPECKREIIAKVQQMIEEGMNGQHFNRHSHELQWLEAKFEYQQSSAPPNGHQNGHHQPLLPLFDLT